MASRGAYARIGSFAASRSAAGACRPRSLSRLRERVGVRVLRAAWFSSLGPAMRTARGTLTLALSRKRSPFVKFF